MPKQIQKRWDKNHRRITSYIEAPGSTFDDRKWHSLIDEMGAIIEDWTKSID